MFCWNCGKQLPDDAGFCYHCGKPIREGRKTQGIITEDTKPKTAPVVATKKQPLLKSWIFWTALGGAVVVAASVTIVTVLLINGSSGGSGEPVYVAEQSTGVSENTGDAGQNPSGGEGIIASESPTETTESTPTPTIEPTPSPTPEPTMNPQDRAFDFDEIKDYCSSNIIDDSYDHLEEYRGYLLDFYKRKVRAYQIVEEDEYDIQLASHVFIEGKDGWYLILETTGYISETLYSSEYFILETTTYNDDPTNWEGEVSLYAYDSINHKYSEMNGRTMTYNADNYDDVLMEIRESIGLDDLSWSFFAKGPVVNWEQQ